jgi:tight adherence protein C
VELILAPLAAFGAVMLLALTLLPGNSVDAKSRVAAFAGQQHANQNSDQPFSRRLLLPALESIGQRLMGILSGNSLKQTQALLDQAGNPMSLEALLALRLAGAVLAPAAYLLMAREAERSPMELLGCVALCWLGCYAPKFWVDQKATKRRRAIERSLPDALDLVVVSMEAGLSLDGALGKVVERTDGPLAQELDRTLREMQLGKSRRDAIRDLAARCAVKDLSTLVNGVIQADQMGVSMAELMRTQADESRMVRRQRAEEKAHQASVKMVIPLIVFILPSLLIVAVGPAMLAIYKALFVGGVFK